uniref:Secreted protein n=1 Tax=Physcomitrium patens TaxID=3218 RepID=A0A2K1IXR1_PHYPA|nr:hypothetical protein PHYPA_023880 [Physcomitrium patens]
MEAWLSFVFFLYFAKALMVVQTTKLFSCASSWFDVAGGGGGYWWPCWSHCSAARRHACFSVLSFSGFCSFSEHRFQSSSRYNLEVSGGSCV